jgi:hypothetical protein
MVFLIHMQIKFKNLTTKYKKLSHYKTKQVSKLLVYFMIGKVEWQQCPTFQVLHLATIFFQKKTLISMTSPMIDSQSF